MYVHPTLVVTPEGLALGVTDSWMRCTERSRSVGAQTQGRGGIQGKYPTLRQAQGKWIEGYERVAEMAAQVPDTRLVYIADREGDTSATLSAPLPGTVRQGP